MQVWLFGHLQNLECACWWNPFGHRSSTTVQSYQEKIPVCSICDVPKRPQDEYGFKNWNTFQMNRTLACSAHCFPSAPSNPRNFAISLAISSVTPVWMSTGIFLIRSGVFSATSSMSTPPSGEATRTGTIYQQSFACCLTEFSFWKSCIWLLLQKLCELEIFLPGPLDSRSIKMQKYVSRVISMASATIT